MKTIFLLVTLFSCCLIAQESDSNILKSRVFEKSNELYSDNIEGYKNNEFWGVWSVPLGECKESSHLSSVNGLSYSSYNLVDYNLNTAWMVPNRGIGEYLEFTLDFSNEEAYKFKGICNVFNGYCKSEAIWNANSRVKKLKVCYDDLVICYVQLVDTWHFQSFDLRKYIDLDRLRKTSGLKKTLRFEILEVYEGTKYKDVGFSEFLCEGTGN